MISIQELGLSILSDSPAKFYVLGGEEYGIKDKYLHKLTELYGESYEYPKVMDVIDMMSTRHLIPLKPALYVIRYDETFVSAINDKVADRIRKAKIIGTVVCIYEDFKHVTKIDKYLPEFTGSIELVNPKFVIKYLHEDFPKLDDRSIQVAARAGANYGHARNICRSMMNADLAELNRMTESQLITLFGCTDVSTESAIRQSVAARNFSAFCKVIDAYDGDLDSAVYTILQTMIELEKVKSSKYSNSDLRDFAKYWTIPDIYYMFMNTYEELSRLRSNTSTDVRCSLIYLAGLLTFKEIPSPEVMHAA